MEGYTRATEWLFSTILWQLSLLLGYKAPFSIYSDRTRVSLFAGTANFCVHKKLPRSKKSEHSAFPGPGEPGVSPCL